MANIFRGLQNFFFLQSLKGQKREMVFWRRLSLRKKNKMANICRSLRTKIFFSPVLKSPTHIGFIDVKKWVENLTLGHL